MDDYRKQRVSEEVAKLQTISGVYQGSLLTVKGGASMGTLIIELEAATTVNQSTDRPSSDQQAALRGKITLEDANGRLFINFSDGFYDSDTHQFQAIIPVTRIDQEQMKIELSGSASGVELTGSLQAQNFPENGGSFKLSKAAPDVGHASKLEPPGTSVQVWVADKDTLPDSKVDVYLTIAQPEKTNDEEFIEKFVPIRIVSTGLIYADLPLDCPNTRWDLRTGKFRANCSASQGMSTFKVSLDCATVTLEKSKLGWNCNYQALSGIQFPLHFKPTTQEAIQAKIKKKVTW